MSEEEKANNTENSADQVVDASDNGAGDVAAKSPAEAREEAKQEINDAIDEINQSGELADSWYWFVMSGAFMFIGGVLALLKPMAASFSVELITGWTYFMAGIFVIIQGFSLKENKFWPIMMGVFAVLTGIALLANPMEGLVSLTFLAGVLIMFIGLCKIIYGWSMQPQEGWFWFVLSGTMSMVLSMAVFTNLNDGALVLLGLFLAIQLLVSGVLMIGLGLHVKDGGKLPSPASIEAAAKNNGDQDSAAATSDSADQAAAKAK